MKIGLRFWMIVFCASCIALPLLAEEDEAPQQDKVVRNTLFALSQRQIQAGEINAAMATLQRILVQLKNPRPLGVVRDIRLCQ